MKGARPLVAPALAFGLGIGFGAWAPPFPPAWGTAAAVLTAALVPAARGRKRTRAAWTALLFFLGLLRFQFAGAASPHAPLPGGDAVVTGEVAAPPEISGGTFLIGLDRARIRTQGVTKECGRRVEVVVEGLPPAAERPAAGDLLTARGNLLPPRRERNFSWSSPEVSGARTSGPRLFVSSPVWIRRAPAPEGGGPAERLGRLRQRAADFWDRRGGGEAAVLKALTTGLRRSIPDGLRESFRRSGLAHLLAVSGLHLGFAALFVYVVLRRSLVWIEPLAARYPVQPMAALGTIPVLLAVYIFSGAQVSAGRAAAMTSLGLGAGVLCRRPDLLNLVACAALLMLALDPHLLFSVAFQLSFAAVTSIVISLPLISGIFHRAHAPPPALRLLRWLTGVVLASLAASAATLPLSAFHFQRLPLAGPALNAAAVPLTGFVVLPLAWGSTLASFIWPAAAERLADVACAACGLLTWIARGVSRHPWSSLALPRPPPALVAALLALALVLPSVRRRRLGAGIAAGAASFCLLLWIGTMHRAQLQAAFLDVGQGDAALIRLPGGETFLVDTGPLWRHGDAGKYVVVPALRKMGMTRLDHVVISHFHPDHAGGLTSILEEVDVREIWTAPFRQEDLPPPLDRALSRWAREGGRLRLLSRGDTWLGRKGSRIDILGPARAASPPSSRQASANDRSLVLLLRWGEAALLMTGDAGAAPLREAAAALPPTGKNAVLKVPHHGGRQGGTDELVRAFAPRWAVVSVGRNGYGHPAPATVESCRRSGEVLRTDRDGAVFLRSGKARMSVRTWRDLAEGRTWRERFRWLFVGW